MFRPMTYAPRGRMSQPVAVASASLARSSPRCQPWSSRPRLPSGSTRLWSGPATKPSSEIDMWQVVSGIGVLPRWLQFASGDSTLVQATHPQTDHRLSAHPRSIDSWADVEIVAVADDPDRHRLSQRAVAAQRSELQLIGRPDPGELLAGPGRHQARSMVDICASSWRS